MASELHGLGMNFPSVSFGSSQLVFPGTVSFGETSSQGSQACILVLCFILRCSKCGKKRHAAQAYESQHKSCFHGTRSSVFIGAGFLGGYVFILAEALS